MADDDRQRGQGHGRAEAVLPAEIESVVLPEYASAYFSPRPPPNSTAHQTIETEAVRLDPAIDPDNAKTQPLQIDGLQPPPWMGERFRSDAPTVLVPIVRERRRRRRLVAGLVAAGVGVIAGVGYGITRPLPPVPAAAPPRTSMSPDPRSTPAPAAAPVSPPAEPSESVPDDLPHNVPLPLSAASAEQTTQPDPHSATTRHQRAVARHAVPLASARPAWVKPEPPKAWFK